VHSDDILLEASGIRYGIAGSEDLDELKWLLAETFTRHDPPAVSVGLTVQEFVVFVEVFSDPAAADGLTIIGRDAESGEMAGGLLSDDLAAPQPLGVARLSDKLGPVFELLDHLTTDYLTETKPDPGDYLHLFLLGVSEGYAGRGIANRLVATCLANGVRRGYSFAVTEATNRTSQHIFSKNGFKTRAQESYAEYRSNDHPVFESFASEGGPMLMERRLTAEA